MKPDKTAQESDDTNRNIVKKPRAAKVKEQFSKHEDSDGYSSTPFPRPWCLGRRTAERKTPWGRV